MRTTEEQIDTVVERLLAETRVGCRTVALLEATALKALYKEPDNKAYLRQYAQARHYRERNTTEKL